MIDFLKVSELTVKTWRSPNMTPPITVGLVVKLVAGCGQFLLLKER